MQAWGRLKRDGPICFESMGKTTWLPRSKHPPVTTPDLHENYRAYPIFTGRILLRYFRARAGQQGTLFAMAFPRGRLAAFAGAEAYGTIRLQSAAEHACRVPAGIYQHRQAHHFKPRLPVPGPKQSRFAGTYVHAWHHLFFPVRRTPARRSQYALEPFQEPF